MKRIPEGLVSDLVAIVGVFLVFFYAGFLVVASVHYLWKYW